MIKLFNGDCLECMKMLDDKSVGAKGLITFNVGDFQDVCHKNSIDILF